MRRRILMATLMIFPALAALSLPGNLHAQSANADQYYAAAGKLYAAKNYAQAAQYYYAAVKVNPNLAAAYQGIGNCYYALGRKSDSLAFYQRASTLQPANAQLAQFVQNLRAQLGAGGATAPGATVASTNPLNQGVVLFQQKQYAASIPYFRLAAQQTPNDYRPYYYAGYAYYMTRDAKSAALYFGVANAKQPNASIQNYANKVKASLSPEDQQWVDDQVAKYVQGSGTEMASSASAASGKSKTSFGFHILGGMDYILADPTQIKQYVTLAQSVSLSGVTPSATLLAGLEPFVNLGNLEIGLSGAFIPVGIMSYTTYDVQSGVNYKYSYDTSIVTGGLEGKILFGDSKIKAYLGLGADVSSVSMTFNKVLVDGSGNSLAAADPSSGDYSTIAIGGHAQLGVDFFLGPGIAVGPYVGYRYLDATNFKNGANTLSIRTQNDVFGDEGEVGADGDPNVKPLDLDLSAINAGLNLTFSF